MDLVLSVCSMLLWSMPQCLLLELSPSTGKDLTIQLPQLSVDGAIHGGPCFLTVFPLLNHFPMSVRASDIQTFSSLALSCWYISKCFEFRSTVIFSFTRPNPFWLVYGLWELELRKKFPCITRNFMVFTSAVSMFSLPTMPDAYQMTGRTYIFMAWILFIPMNWIFKILWWYLDATALLASSLWLPCGVPRVFAANIPAICPICYQRVHPISHYYFSSLYYYPATYL